MTDYTKLIEGLRKEAEFDHNHETLSMLLCAADAIEALQAECAEHKENAIRNARIAVSIRAERDALQDKLDELTKQEPVGYFKRSGFGLWWNMSPAEQEIQGVVPLYAAPKALEPEPVEPVAWFAFGDSNGPVPLELFGWDEKACKHAVLTNARAAGWKGTLDGYLYQQGWTIKPVYTYAATKALAPLTDEQIDRAAHGIGGTP